MGAVLHTFEPAAAAGQLTWIANHAEDRVIIVDSTVLAFGGGVAVDDLGAHGASDRNRRSCRGRGVRKDVLRYDDVVAAQSERSTGPTSTSGQPQR